MTRIAVAVLCSKRRIEEVASVDLDARLIGINVETYARCWTVESCCQLLVVALNI